METGEKKKKGSQLKKNISGNENRYILCICSMYNCKPKMLKNLNHTF